jgi:hypothetical protein
MRHRVREQQGPGRSVAPPLTSALIHRSAWKRNSQKFVSRSGHLAYMLCSVPLLRSDSQAGHPLDLPLPRAARLSCLPASAVLGHLGRDYAELRLYGVLRSSAKNEFSEVLGAT